MAEKLSKRLCMETYSSVYQEAILSVLVAAEELNRRIEEVCDAHGITLQQYNVLRILRGAHPDGHARCDILDRMIQRAPDVTRLINRLVTQKLATRNKSDKDGRLSITYITKKGLALLDVLQPNVSAIERDLTGKLTKEQARLLADLCDGFIGL